MTKRQAECLHLASQGLSNAAIAAQLGISQSSVKTHLQHVYMQLGLNAGTGNPRVRALLMYQNWFTATVELTRQVIE